MEPYTTSEGEDKNFLVPEMKQAFYIWPMPAYRNESME
jgi:hypothetical protein